MMKIREAVKCVPVILGYFLLTEFGKMIEFWIFMAHQTESDLYEQQWSWITMPESRFFQIPGRTGLLFAALIAVLLCMLAHGKDFRAGQLKKIKETLQINWRKILFQAILIVGVVLGVAYTRFLDRIASAISMKDIYFYISGTGALAGTQIIENIAERFSTLVAFHEPDLWTIPFSFLVFELLRVCFDSKMTLT
ncbi:hypothetical protein [Waltera sp.]|jgi:hypothetical protein|uniref:hypothetical protein n=1 Tax=Waltera sp. TaxID=2815806 RepID=UPI003AB96626